VVEPTDWVVVSMPVLVDGVVADVAAGAVVAAGAAVAGVVVVGALVGASVVGASDATDPVEGVPWSLLGQGVSDESPP
jgi:hypothetical protein